MLYFLLSLLSLILSLFCTTSYMIPEEINGFLNSKYFGKASFWTFWVRALFILTLSLYLCISIQKKFGYQYFFFIALLRASNTILLCCSLSMTAMYWILLSMDYHNMYPVLPKNIRMPLLPDITLHLLPLIISAILSLRVRFYCSLMTIVYFILLGSCYSFVSIYGFYSKGEWPYPFMEKYSTKVNLLLHLVTVVSVIGIYLVLRDHVLSSRKKRITTVKNGFKPTINKKSFKKR